MTRPAVRISDVARRSGVSTTTVSHVLNDKGRVADATRQRVLEAAEALGYRPNPVARSLVTGRTGIVAITASWSGDPYFPFAEYAYYNEVIAGATGGASARGQALVVGPTGAPESLWHSLPMDGVIVIVIDPAADDPKIAALAARGVPMVTIGRRPDGGTAATVESDDRAAARWALDHLDACGARRIGVLTLPPVESFTADAVEASREWFARQGRAEIVECAVSGEAGWEGAVREAVRRFLDRPEPPDGALCLEGMLARELVTQALDRGLRIPHDLRIVTANDSAGLIDGEPPLTTLDFDPRTLGATAVGLLLDLLDGKVGPHETRSVPITLTPRTSTIGRNDL